MPLLVLDRIVILSAVRLVDRIFSFFLRWNLPAPLPDVLGQVRGARGCLCPLAPRVLLVWFHAARRCVYDEHTTATRVLEDLVHARAHFFGPAHGIQAVMSVPHVTYDDGRFSRVPLLGLLPGREGALGRLLAEALVNRDRSATARLGTNEVTHRSEEHTSELHSRVD